VGSQKNAQKKLYENVKADIVSSLDIIKKTDI